MAGQVEKGLASLTVWKKAIDFAEWIIKEILVLFPAEERYALASQLRRSVQSIPANIAEGYGRFYYQEGVRFCYIARGSLEESRSHLELACRLNYITGDQKRTAEEKIGEILRLLNGFITYLKEKKPGLNEPGSTIREDAPGYAVNSIDEHETV